jgi:long-chain acyl-CoA synthetase
VPDARWGEAVHAVVVMADEAAATADELRAWCRERLAGYKCPRGISFLRELPMSAAGKVLKNVLREQLRP